MIGERCDTHGCRNKATHAAHTWGDFYYCDVCDPPRKDGLPKEEPPDLKELGRLSHKLTELVKDPHPGLFSWRSLLKETILQIAEFSGEEPVIAAATEVLVRKGYRK